MGDIYVYFLNHETSLSADPRLTNILSELIKNLGLPRETRDDRRGLVLMTSFLVSSSVGTTINVFSYDTARSEHWTLRLPDAEQIRFVWCHGRGHRIWLIVILILANNYPNFGGAMILRKINLINIIISKVFVLLSIYHTSWSDNTNKT